MKKPLIHSGRTKNTYLLRDTRTATKPVKITYYKKNTGTIRMTKEQFVKRHKDKFKQLFKAWRNNRPGWWICTAGEKLEVAIRHLFGYSPGSSRQFIFNQFVRIYGKLYVAKF